MTAEQLHDAIGMLDEELLIPTDRLRQGGGTKKLLYLRRYLSAAACLAVILGCALAYRVVGNLSRSAETTSAQAEAALDAGPERRIAAQGGNDIAEQAETAPEEAAEDSAVSGSTAKAAEPYALTVSAGGESQAITAGNYTWTTEGADGESQTVTACGAAPWEQESLEPLILPWDSAASSQGSTLALSWATQPESVTVRAYVPGQEAEITVTYAEGSLELLAGDYLYCVTAQWPQGEAEYVFRINR